MEKTKVFFLAVTFIISFISSSLAATTVSRPNVIKEAEIVSVKGDAWIRFGGTGEWTPAAIGQVLTSGDSVRTGTFGKLDILFVEGTQIKVNDNTVFTIKQVRKPKDTKGSTILFLEIGEIWSRAKSVPQGFKIETPSATAEIRGTDWDIVVDNRGTSYVTVLKGSVELFNDFGTVSVNAGEQAMAEKGKPPVKMFLVRPRDRVQWIISYSMDFAKIIPFHSHRRDEAAKLLSSAQEKVRQHPDDTESKLRLAGTLYDLNQRQESLTLFDEILKTEPNNTKALTFKGLILLGRAEMDVAVPCFEQALKTLQGRDRTESLLGMAGVHLLRNETPQAEKILEDLKTSDPSALTGIALASFRAYQGAFVGAIGICNEYASRYPEDERFPAMAADFSLTLDEPEKAKEYIHTALKINPASSRTYAVLGRYHHLAGRGKEAEQAYREAIRIDPADAEATSELGKLLMEKGHFEESITVHTQATELNPKSHIAWSKKGMLMNWIEEIGKAESDYKSAVDLNPLDFQALDGMGYLKLKEGKPSEALGYFQKAGLVEPKFAEPHIFAAIAYYQLEEFDRALEELGLAETLDPKDPVPHMMAYLIYQDTYKPMEAVNEATKALELLPNLKSVNPIETTQKGLTNLGSALLNMGLTAWGTSYAEESFNPHNADSYFFVSKKYDSNPFISVSTVTQGFLLDPISITYAPRYQDIVRRPQHTFSINTTLGDEDGGFYRKHTLTQQGYIRQPWEMNYLLSLDNHEGKGFRENGYSRGNFLSFGFGGKPDFKNGFFIWGGLDGKISGDPGPVTNPDSDDRNMNTIFFLSSGYNHRFGPKNNLLLNFSYGSLRGEFHNSDPFGTGLSSPEISFIKRFGTEDALKFFKKGIYDDGVSGDIHYYFTDSTGTAKLFGYSAIPFSFSTAMDLNPMRKQIQKHEDMGFQLRHLVEIGDGHDISYGIEYVPTMRFMIKEYNAVSETGRYILFYDDLLLDKTEYAMLERENRNTASSYSYKSEAMLAYINDRWRISENLLFDIGLYHERFKQENTIDNTRTKYNGFHPRFGLEWKIGKMHILRAAYQKHLYPGATLSLSPLATGGLFFEWIQLNPGARITDYQIGLESRWTGRIFTVLNVEERKFFRDDTREKNTSHFFTAAVNAILTDRVGAFLAYKFAESDTTNGYYRDKALPFLPKHAFGSGVAWILPSYLKATIATYYITDQYGDKENTRKLPDFWTTDLGITWEPKKKHWMFKLAVTNMFNNNYDSSLDYPAAGRSAYLTAEYRF